MGKLRTSGKAEIAKLKRNTVRKDKVLTAAAAALLIVPKQFSALREQT